MKAVRNVSALVISIFMLAMIAGCGGEPVKPSAENVRATAALAVLEQMRAAYAARDMQGVLDRVSTSLADGYSAFSARVRRDMERYEKVELKLFIERVELEGDATTVVFHWHGKWWERNGTMVEGRGNSEFQFAGEAEIKLIKIVGDNPFGIVW